MVMPEAHSELELSLIDAIGSRGPLNFAEFMDSALYDPDHGYYPTRRRRPGSTPVGTDGDYFTSPVTHPAFGALLAVQLRQMWQLLGSPDEFVVVEMGAGDGVLGSDIAEYAERQLPDFAPAMRYVAIDLVPPADSNTVRASSELPTGVTGCVISNELLDAIPVNRFVVQAGALKEIFVDYRDGGFVELTGDVSDPEFESRITPFLGTLPDGYRGEINLRLSGWAESVAATLDSGFVMTIDYGYDRADLYTPERSEGSLRSYYQHTLGQNPLRRIGKQDITAHVDFTAVDETLAAVGFHGVGSATQSEFLVNLGIDEFLSDIRERSARGELSRVESEEDLAGTGALINPEGLGGFRVAVHSRGVEIGGEQLQGLSGVGGAASAAGSSLGSRPGANPLKTPLLEQATAGHARLLRSSNPFGQSQSQIGIEGQTPGMPTWEELFSDEP